MMRNGNSTKPTLATNNCYAFGFLFTPIFGFASAPILSRKQFKIQIIMSEKINLVIPSEFYVKIDSLSKLLEESIELEKKLLEHDLKIYLVPINGNPVPLTNSETNL